MTPQTTLPSGTVTFLLTDIEGSTKLWETQPVAMQTALARHDALLRAAILGAGGVVFKTIGDAFCAAFASAPSALDAVIAAQTALLAEPWPEQTLLRVRMALHTGTVEERDNDYFGPPVNRVARLLSAGHGGQTLVSAATYELVRDRLPDGVGLRNLGLHRLKDLERPEHVFQVTASGLTDAFAPLKTLDTTPNNLPQQLTSFIGREKPIADATALLAKTRLLTLTGAGGSGKTRLSLQVAADVLDAYSDGAWQIELAPLSDALLVPQAIASVLGVKEQAGQTVTQTLTSWLKDKTLLLVLDNCEHLLAACAQLTAALLRACPQVKILATSREPLGIGGETTYRIPSLSLPTQTQAKTATAENLSQFEAVRLFIERAQAVKPDFVVTNQSAPALAQLCFHLDGIPLAIELAAARVRSLAVEQINDKLVTRFRLLTGGDKAALPRQQTLRALVDWSYDLLTEKEKTMLTRLSVFAGGWTLEAAESVCGFDPVEDLEVLDLLTSLADKSLIVVEEIDGAEAESGAARYRMLETLRQYGAEKMDVSGEGETISERYIACFITLAEEAQTKLNGPKQIVWLNRLETEYDNFRAAIDFCVSDDAPLEAKRETGEARTTRVLMGLRLVSLLKEFWNMRGYVGEGREFVGRALAAHQAVRPADGEPAKPRGEVSATQASQAAQKAVADALSASAFLLMCQSVKGAYSAAKSLYDESLVLYREIGDKSGIAFALCGMGRICIGFAEYATSRTLYEQSLSLYREVGDKGGMASVLQGLALLASRQSQRAEEKSFYEQALALYREIGDPNGIADGLTTMGWFAGDAASARSFYEEALALRRESGNKRAIAFILLYLAGLTGIAHGESDNLNARSLLMEGMRLAREIGDQGLTAVLQGSLGGLAKAEGDSATARSLYVESLTFFVGVDNKSATQDYLGRMSGLCRDAGEVWQSIVFLAAAQALRERIGLTRIPDEQAKFDARIEQMKAELGEEEFAAAWNEGYALSMEQALDVARKEGPPAKRE